VVSCTYRLDPAASVTVEKRRLRKRVGRWACKPRRQSETAATVTPDRARTSRRESEGASRSDREEARMKSGRAVSQCLPESCCEASHAAGARGPGHDRCWQHARQQERVGMRDSASSWWARREESCRPRDQVRAEQRRQWATMATHRVADGGCPN
jgi:hypothetical protein